MTQQISLPTPVIAGIGAGVALLITLWLSCFTISEGQQALVVRLGDLRRTITKPGLHYKVPLIDTVIPLDARLLAVEIEQSEIIAADKKRLTVDAFARYKITDAAAFYRAVGNLNAADVRLQTILSSGMRRVLGLRSALDIIAGNRSEVIENIRSEMQQETKIMGLQIVDVRIRRADLPKNNSEAVYQRMQSERRREAEQFRAEGNEQARITRARAERTATILVANAKRDAEIKRGEGDAERSRIFADAFGQDPVFFNMYRTLNAYVNIFKDNSTTFVLPADADVLKPLLRGFK